MFTNWLTGTSGSNCAGNGTNNNEQMLIVDNMTSSILSNPPDVVLEVGPTSPTVRFMAHSMVLVMHSGFLSSAVRLDEQRLTTNNLIIYLTSVTAEQFSPLLTYMYTGYLDLNVENIFGVLLATHVLHMPRALEICRAFLSRAQSDGYMSNLLANSSTSHVTIAAIANNSTKIIRPIPSKASSASYSYLQTANTAASSIEPTTISQQLVLQLSSFKNLQQQPTPYNLPQKDVDDNTMCTESQNGEEINVDRSSSRGSLELKDQELLKSQQQKQQITIDEDEEVFIDGNSTNEVDHFVTKPFSTTIIPTSKLTTRRKNKTNKSKCKKRVAKTGNNLGLQVAKAPIPASLLEPTEGTKVIIDIASCDGPVRFRRILNTAYGHKPDAIVEAPERTPQSVSLSFQQQMARTIREQTEDNENKDAVKTKSLNNEIYVCVYCKHTFKSQYCYQKHAKRHLNPLSLSCSRAAATLTDAITKRTNDKKHTTELSTTTNANASGSKLGVAAVNILRREVRPLDMNVQYYPCKTCGCKFPSYYFVHKHRKLCHAEEETAIVVERGTEHNNANAEAANNHETDQEDT